MKLSIPRDQLLNPISPRVFLCNTARTILGELPATAVNLNAKWRQYGELTFEIQRTYVDLIDGTTKVHPLYDKVEAPRNVLLEGYGLFCLQDIDDTSGESDTKSVSAFSLEYTTSNTYLTNFHINTGEIDSKEVLYNEQQAGIDYNTDKDSFYKFAEGDFDPYESYYQRNYTDTDSYTYERVQIANATEYNALLGKSNATNAQLADRLYMKTFPNVQFYNANRKSLSLLHLVFDNIPNWEIGNVDQSLWHKERKFSHDRTSIYDFLMNDVCETFGCTFVWDSLTGLVHVYEEVEDDEMENAASTRWETDVYISKDNLASECKVSYSSDNIKTKLVVTGADNLDIREVNLGRNEIMDLSFYHTDEWMEPDLFQKYSEYKAELSEAQTGLTVDGVASDKYPMSYPNAMQGWVSANNKHHELMYAVPAEANVLRVGDEFKKLFCVYEPIDTAYAKNTTITASTSAVTTLYYDEQCTVPVSGMANNDVFVVQGFKLTYSSSSNTFVLKTDDQGSLIPNSKKAIIKKLNQYHVDEDTQADKTDNILLKLKNSSSDVVTIRIYDPKAVVPSSATIEDHLNYYTKGNDNKYTKIKVESTSEFAGGNVYTNDYKIHSVTVKATDGTPEAAKTYTLDQWLKGELTAKMYDTKGMDLEGYTVSHIGTMGAYFVLAKDEIVVDDNGALQVSQQYLDACGVNLLKEKHDIYTTLFQTQTEAMLSQEKHQCIIQDDQPTGVYNNGTRWLDSNDPNTALYEYKKAAEASSGTWERVMDTTTSQPVNPTDEEIYHFENYQRYLDNFNKLKAVQKALVTKEREATYCLDGYEVNDATIKWSTLDDGSSVPENFETIAQSHLNSIQSGYNCTGQLVRSKPWILYTFTTSYDPITYAKNTKAYNSIEQYYIKSNYIAVAISSQSSFDTYDGTTEEKTLYIVKSEHPYVYEANTAAYNANTQYYIKRTSAGYVPVDIDSPEIFAKYTGTTDATSLYVVTKGHTFAIYIKDNKPYVGYLHSQGVYNMIMENIRTQTEMSTFFTRDQWIRLSPFIKEDEYNDSNFLLTGYESEEERLSIAQELMEAATKELKSLCKPSLEFSMTMANILALPEFEPLVNQFQLGNFIRVAIRDDYVKRTRLLEVNLNFDDMSDFSATFGNLVSVKSEVDRHADLLSQAVTAGKTVAKSSSTWQKTTEKANKLETDIANGLKDMALAIGNASGQAISWDHTGMHFRKYKEGSTTEFEPEEIAIINNSLVATNDSWMTSKAAFGKYTINGEERWGPIAEYVTADTIEGKIITGGSLRIGGREGDKGEFIVTEDGEVIIRGNDGSDKYAAKELENAYRFQVVLTYDGSTVFIDKDKDFCQITCEVYDNGVSITSDVLQQAGSQFEWINSSIQNWTPTYVLDAGQQPIPNKIIVRHDHVDRTSYIKCSVTFDETEFETDDNTGGEGGASE